MELLELKQEAIIQKNTLSVKQDQLSNERKVLHEQIEKLTAEFADEHATLIEDVEVLKERVATKESELREALISTYEADPNQKQFGDGLSVRVNTKVAIDEKQGVAWAIEHDMPNLLKVNLTPYKKLASIQDLDFVTKTESVSAVIKWDK